MTEAMFSKQHLLKALKEAGLPASYPTMLEYEKKGILPEPTKIVFSDREWRLYTAEQITSAVDGVRDYVSNRDKPKEPHGTV